MKSVVRVVVRVRFIIRYSFGVQVHKFCCMGIVVTVWFMVRLGIWLGCKYLNVCIWVRVSVPFKGRVRVSVRMQLPEYLVEGIGVRVRISAMVSCRDNVRCK